MTFSIFDILGTIGTLTIIVTYVFLQIGKIKSAQLSYSLLNAVGATLIVISLTHSFNLSAFIVEFFWALISIYGIIKYFLTRN